MKRINTPDERFHDGDPTTGELGTIVTAEWLNHLQDEVAGVVEGQKIALDGTKRDQLAEAIRRIIIGQLSDSITSTAKDVGASSAAIKKVNDNADGRLAKSANLGDLTNKATARKNLGLGTAATLSTTASRTDSAISKVLQAKAMNDHRTSGDHDSRYLLRDANSTLRTNADTTLTISANDAHNATLAVHGDNQGTGRVYVGQDTSYGGGIEYNGDGSPVTTGAGVDQVTLFRRANGVDSWTARNQVNSNVWEFREAPTVGGKRVLHTGDSIIPHGLITLWSGAISAVPGGWALCDGNNGTPDLRDRFIVGAGSSYKPGEKGGASSIKLTTGQLPAHNHSMGSAGAHSHSASTGSAGSHNHSASTGSAGSHSHTGSTNTTGNHTHSYTSALGSGTRGDFDGDGGHGGQQTSSAGAHSHSVSINSGGAHTHTVSVASATAHTHSVSVASSGAHTHSIGNTGSGAAHENRPPYYALAYIMKL